METMNLPQSILQNSTEEVRLESVRTSRFLAVLSAALERYLDIMGEVFEFSPDRSEDNSISCIPKRPQTFQGAGMAVTFPFRDGVGVFLISERGNILPDWFTNPGIAGRSRLLLLASELEQLFASEQKNNTPETLVVKTPFENIEFGIDEERNFEQKTISTTGTFYATPKFFYGAIAELERLFAGSAMENITHFRSFSIRKFDAREGYAWMFGPISSVDILHENASRETLPPKTPSTLRPVRSLEAVVVDISDASNGLPEEMSGTEEVPLVESNEVTSVVESVVESEHLANPIVTPNIDSNIDSNIDTNIDTNIDSNGDLKVDSNVEGIRESFPEILVSFPHLVYRFHFRANLYSPCQRAGRKASILSQIRYEHPRFTQRWRECDFRQRERFEAELQSAILMAGVMARVSAPVVDAKDENAPPVSNVSVSNVSDVVATLMETRLQDMPQSDLCAGVETVNLLNAEILENYTNVTVTMVEEWEPTENATEAEESEIFTVESLLETEENVENAPEDHAEWTPFETDFALDADGGIFPAVKSSEAEKRVADIPVQVSVSLGRARQSVTEILGWQVGDILNLGQKIEDSSEVFINGCCAGKGFPVEWENRVGVVCKGRYANNAR